MARVKHELHTLLDAIGFVEKVGEEHIYPTLPTAVAAYADYYTRVHGAPPSGIEPIGYPRFPSSDGKPGPQPAG